eukprot:TRINITY_DN4829_c0_g1_i2.p1 TRINITY_DN4829_c0_g1~~TRINITY_DN4829_c0_g1_i2.p1  ORF type:complete len:444 (-),score=110.04 TRINITY_DN4829_c0_g1_i2:142-1473(-)
MAFQGSMVYLCENLVSAKQFSDLKNILNVNGADVHLDIDPSANSANQYHIIGSSNHEKFSFLKEQGCNLIGPECVFRCAKEQRHFPKQQYTCCLAMDGVKVLASGFDKKEKANMQKLVTAMGGEFMLNVSLDVDFLITKDVLSPKYKWALEVSKKPIVTVDWLHQCYREHRIVPYKPHKIPPFKGLTICVTGIDAGKREQIAQLVVQNGGSYSRSLSVACTHLICNVAEGDKYMFAQKKGHIKVVNEKWLSHSIAAKACLNEKQYPVQKPVISTAITICTGDQSKQARGFTSEIRTVQEERSALQPLSSEASETAATTDHVSIAAVECDQRKSEHGDLLADDSQAEENDLYLENCKIFLAGFQPDEMRVLVAMVRRGGGSRYMSFHNSLTHVIVGRPSDTEMKEVRRLLSSGIVHVVRTLWLEDCTRERREVEVTDRHSILKI